MFAGKSLSLSMIEDGICSLTFDLQDSSVNKFDRQTVAELSEAIDILSSQSNVTGLVILSNKPAFIVGADIGEFLQTFKSSDDVFQAEVLVLHNLFARIENLPFPTVAAINGIALGGGFELCLACDFRIATADTLVGLPEVKLGLLPGWGGTIRLPRITDADTAADWIISGKPQSAKNALDCGAIDQLAENGELISAACAMIKHAGLHSASYSDRRTKKRSSLLADVTQTAAVMDTHIATAEKIYGKHYPAAKIAMTAIKDHLYVDQQQASQIETSAFVAVARTATASSLIALFLNDQYMKKQAKQYAGNSTPINSVGVLGAGIMGGGIAYQSALKGMSVVMKDINDAALELGMGEADKRLSSLVHRGRLSDEKKQQVLARIKPTLCMDELRDCELVIEAVVENADVKLSVLSECEKVVDANATIASNTSTISIDKLSAATERAEQFCGIHFFNPVHVMPLVEIIRGRHTSEQSVSNAVSYVQSIGKRPVVVNNCPGFLVNRVLFPYIKAFDDLVNEGVDFRQIDRVMTDLGWPMGPAHLLDVVGIDTAIHAGDIMAEAFPQRMNSSYETVTRKMLSQGRLGQKSASGFYRYELDERGRQVKTDDDNGLNIAYGETPSFHSLADQDIVDRMMIPLCIELVRCLEENIIDSPIAADMSLIWGLGFPTHIGGGFRYIDRIGIVEFCRRAGEFSSMGIAYNPTSQMLERASLNKSYF